MKERDIEAIFPIVLIMTLLLLFFGGGYILERYLDFNQGRMGRQLRKLASRYSGSSDGKKVELRWSWARGREAMVCHVAVKISGGAVPRFLRRQVAFSLEQRRISLPRPGAPRVDLNGESPPDELLWLDELWDCLDEEARAVLARASFKGMWIADGVVGADFLLERDVRPARIRTEIEDLLPTLIAAHSALALDLDRCSTLSSEADWALPSSIRLRRLRRRCRRFADSPATLTTCLVVQERGSSLEQLVAANFLGVEELRAFAEQLEPDSVPAELWLEVRAGLEAHLSPERLGALLDPTLEATRTSTIHALLIALRSSRASIPVELLRRVVERHAEPELLRDLIALLVARPGGEGEALLGVLLEKSYRVPDQQAELVKLEMVRALGAMGTRAAVRELRGYLRSHYITWRLTNEARAALVRARANVDARIGQLTLAAEHAGGELSFSEHDGALGLADDQDGVDDQGD